MQYVYNNVSLLKGIQSKKLFVYAEYALIISIFILKRNIIICVWNLLHFYSYDLFIEDLSFHDKEDTGK